MLLALSLLLSLDGSVANVPETGHLQTFAPRIDAGSGSDVAPLQQSALLLDAELGNYVPGATGAGILIGGRTAGGVTLGVTAGLGTQALSVGGNEQFETVWGLGAAARVRLFATEDNKVTLEVGADMRLARHVPNLGPPVQNSTAPPVVVTGNGFVLAGGPTVTYWVHPRLGIGYTPRLTFLSTSDPAGGVSRVSLMNVLHVVLTF
jgi:hypothetical protein